MAVELGLMKLIKEVDLQMTEKSHEKLSANVQRNTRTKFFWKLFSFLDLGTEK